MPTFHLSLPVPELRASVTFFSSVLAAEVTHVDASGYYVNLDLAGVQLTLTLARRPHEAPSELHFGINFNIPDFRSIEARVKTLAPDSIEQHAHVVDAGTPRERHKMYLRCPAGSRIEIKGSG